MTDAVQELPGLVLERRPARVSSPGERVAAPAGGWRLADALLGAGILLAVIVGSNLDRMPQGLEEFLAFRLSLKNVVLLTAFGVAWPAVLALCGLYAPARLREGKGEWPRLVVAAAVACVLAMVFPLTSRSGAVRPEHALLFALMVAPATAAVRAAVRVAQRLARPIAARNVVIIGSGPRACAAYLELKGNRRISYDILGFVDDTTVSPPAGAFMRCLGGLQQFEAILAEHVVDEVRIALPIKSMYDVSQRAIGVCERVGVEFSYPLDTFQHALTWQKLSRHQGRSTLNGAPVPNEEDLPLKRAFDVVVALTMLVLLAVPIVLIALAVKITSRGPVLFVQQRYGKNKRLFRMYKFRSMRVDAEAELRRKPELYEEYLRGNFKLPEDRDPRITALGRLLRKSSLDELPQVWNVLRGDMSVVGPRPIVPAEVGQYQAVASLLLALKPGLTSMWVVEGRSSVGYPRRAQLELQYVRNWSLFRDLMILLRTVPVVLRGTGAH